VQADIIGSYLEGRIMGKIARTAENLFSFPKGAFVVNHKYLYINTSNHYVKKEDRKTKGERGYTGHDQACIGVVMNPDDENCRQFYANKFYHEKILNKDLNKGQNKKQPELPEPPETADSVSVGFHCFISNAAEQKNLISALTEVFGTDDTRQILDLANYMISRESAVMQHYPAWAREHALFSETIRDDSFLGKFLRGSLTIPKINCFKKKWASQNIGDGKVYLCYDSTNVNSQAEGVCIVQKGFAKDDKTLPQVNTDYVVRQADGMPLTYMHSPGSVADIAQAQEMIKFFDGITDKDGKNVSIVLVCDRGYISENNLKQMDEAGIGYLLMLRTSFGKHKELCDKFADRIHAFDKMLSSPNDEDEKYGVTDEIKLVENGRTCYAHVIWSENLYKEKRSAFDKDVMERKARLADFIQDSANLSFTDEEIEENIDELTRKLFTLKREQTGLKIVQKKTGKGRDARTEGVPTPTFRITGFSDDIGAFDRERMKCGMYVLVSSERITAQQAIDGYSRRDCVEKMFEALKSHMGMDKIGVTSEEAMHGKGLVWFVASILYSMLSNGTSALRARDKKHFTVPAMVDELEAIKADKDLASGTYGRRYKLTKRQGDILGCWGIKEKDIDECIDAQL
jgi:transposase